MWRNQTYRLAGLEIWRQERRGWGHSGHLIFPHKLLISCGPSLWCESYFLSCFPSASWSTLKGAGGKTQQTGWCKRAKRGWHVSNTNSFCFWLALSVKMSELSCAPRCWGGVMLMSMTQTESARSFGSRSCNTALAFFCGPLVAWGAVTEMSEENFTLHLVVSSCRSNCSRSWCEWIPKVRTCPTLWGTVGLWWGKHSTLN